MLIYIFSCTLPPSPLYLYSWPEKYRISEPCVLESINLLKTIGSPIYKIEALTGLQMIQVSHPAISKL